MNRLPPLAVFDIDGVVADVRHRLSLVTGGRHRWDLFFDAAGDDPLLPQGREAVEVVRDSHEVVWLTGRPERIRAETQTWLLRHGLPHGDLHMRPDGDHRPARRLKAELLARLAAGRTVAVVVDDDMAVVRALRQAGWPVQHADWVSRGLVARALTDVQERRGRT